MSDVIAVRPQTIAWPSAIHEGVAAKVTATQFRLEQHHKS
jgi:hypothetical protein